MEVSSTPLMEGDEPDQPVGTTPTTTTITTTTDPNNNEDRAPVVQVQDLPLDWTRLGGINTSNNADGEGGSATEHPIVLRYPSDVVDNIDMEETELCIVGTAGQKITVIGNDFSRTVNTEMKSLILRSHIIRKMEGLQYFTNLQLLELYDNQIETLSNLNEGVNGCPGTTLRTLDMSYNSIRDMQPIEFCPNLLELCT
jgi:Leucine-rich repeat (LRR) protein